MGVTVSGGYSNCIEPPSPASPPPPPPPFSPLCLCQCEASSCDLLDIILMLRQSLMLVLDDVAPTSSSTETQTQHGSCCRMLLQQENLIYSEPKSTKQCWIHVEEKYF